MNGKLIILSFFIFSCFTHCLNAQSDGSKRPKLGLCLSGGAAKGIAHIPLLKAIDSLGIRVDYISGTSMGAVIGGLYAIGYTGKQIDSLCRKLDWDVYFTNQIPLIKINITEKDEYGRYLFNVAVNKKSIDLPAGIIEGHALLNLLQTLTFRAALVNDFNQLPIPFKCMATDAVKGEAVTLDNGNLPLAIRTSMSLPTIFTPIVVGDSVLVDGGVVKNFPVDVVKEMGAEIVIGSNVGGRLYNRKELASFVKLFVQITGYVNDADAKRQSELCDVLIDFTSTLESINVGSTDFAKTADILAASEMKVKEIMPELQVIADNQKKYSASEPPHNRFSNLNMTDSFRFAKVEIENQNGESSMSNFIKQQFVGLKDSFITLKEINRNIELLISFLNFTKIYYTTETRNGENVFILHTAEAPKSESRIGVHYDSDQGAGIIANLTLRNLIGQNSRAILSLDISDNFKVRMDYRKYTNNNKYWFNGRFYFEQINTPTRLFYLGRLLENYNHNLTFGALGINYSIGPSAYAGCSVFYQDIAFTPRTAATDPVFLAQNDTATQLSRYNNNYWGLEWRFIQNTFNKVAFPTKGHSLSITLRNQFGAEANYQTTKVVGLNIIGVEKNNQKAEFYTKLMASFEWAKPINNKWTFTLQSHLGVRFLDSVSNENYFKSDPFFVGGVESRNNISFFPFAGNSPGFTQHKNFTAHRIGLQMALYKGLLVTPTLSLLLGDAVLNNSDIFALGYRFHAYTSFGFSFGYDTAIGPISLNITKADNDATWQKYLSIGFRL